MGEMEMSRYYKIDPQRRAEFRKKGYWGDATILDYWNLNVKTHPDHMAVTDAQGSLYTYKELDLAASKAASYLKKQGVAPGDIVSFNIPGWAEFLLIYIACLKAGAAANPLLHKYRSKELKFTLNKCRSKVVFLACGFKQYDYLSSLGEPASLHENFPYLRSVVLVEKNGAAASGAVSLREILETEEAFTEQVPASGDDLAAVLFTSGTEGNPKGAMLTHNNLISSARSYSCTLGVTPYDIHLMSAPLGHATGFYWGINMPVVVGCPIVLQEQFKVEETLELIEKHRVTASIASTPFVFDILRQLEKTPRDISSLRFYMCGGAPVPRSLVHQAKEKGIQVMSVYGSTETAANTMTIPLDSEEKIINTDGAAAFSYGIKIVDRDGSPVEPGREGEELCYGPCVFMGYLDEPEITSRALGPDGWYHSGDLCVMDADGYIRITGRIKDIIVRGGENISSLELEDILYTHPAVQDASVVSMPDERLGERACAFLVMKRGEAPLNLKDIQALFSKHDVAKYKYPERVEIIDELPRNPAGKVQKNILREILCKL